jgi:hypothetical protein
VEVSLGTFKYDRETKNTFVYVRKTDTGRKESQYVTKDDAAKIDNPEAIEVVIRPA